MNITKQYAKDEQQGIITLNHLLLNPGSRRRSGFTAEQIFEYVDECDQEGYQYWNQFATEEELFTDMRLYFILAAE
jgi:hypothetical protein